MNRRMGSAVNPNIKDVARSIGVSYKTVSRVINGGEHVTPEMRQRVEAAIATLRYQPDHTAQSLRRGRTQTLRLVIVRRFERFLTEPFIDEVVSGIVDAAAEAGYAILLEAINPQPDAGSSVAPGRRADGSIIIDGRQDNPAIRPEHLVGHPYVMIPTRPNAPEADWVYADFRGGAREVTTHLIAQGHTRIGHLAGRLSLPERDRLRGYRDALTAVGIPIDPTLVVVAGHLRHHGASAMAKLLDRRPDLTAVFAVNDLTALGAMEFAQQRGLRIPDDVSIAGFDDIYLAGYANPPLTTVRLPAYEMGRAATQRLIATIGVDAGTDARTDGGESNRTELRKGQLFPVEIVPRGSVCPPREGSGRRPTPPVADGALARPDHSTGSVDGARQTPER